VVRSQKGGQGTDAPRGHRQVGARNEGPRGAHTHYILSRCAPNVGRPRGTNDK
jgi:hypothetical protein